jgi:hypothetical protein
MKRPVDAAGPVDAQTRPPRLAKRADAFRTDRMKRLAPLSDVVACAPRLLTRSQAQ